jgi:hypothetical protein
MTDLIGQSELNWSSHSGIGVARPRPEPVALWIEMVRVRVIFGLGYPNARTLAYLPGGTLGHYPSLESTVGTLEEEGIEGFAFVSIVAYEIVSLLLHPVHREGNWSS